MKTKLLVLLGVIVTTSFFLNARLRSTDSNSTPETAPCATYFEQKGLVYYNKRIMPAGCQRCKEGTTAIEKDICGRRTKYTQERTLESYRMDIVDCIGVNATSSSIAICTEIRPMMYSGFSCESIIETYTYTETCPNSR